MSLIYMKDSTWWRRWRILSSVFCALCHCKPL